MSSSVNRNGGNSIPMTTTTVGAGTPGGGGTASEVNLNVGNLVGNNTCIHSRNVVNQPPQSINHIDAVTPDQMQLLNTNSLIDDSVGHTTYFMNRDGCMETASVNDAAAVQAMGGFPPVGLPPAPPPPGSNPNVINPQGLKSLVHDVQVKRQKEIRDLMKKKREKAVLVDRISRWLFPTSFILLNIVYWALFGDHDLW